MYIEFDRIDLSSSASLSQRDFACEADLKDWVWEHHKDRLLEHMHVVYEQEEPRSQQQEQTQAQQAQERNYEQRLKVLDQVMRVQRRYLLSEDPQVVYGSLLESVLELTNSKYGFIGEVIYGDQGQFRYMQTHSFTNIAWDEASQKLFDDRAERGLRFYNTNTLFGAVIRTKKPVISNNPRSDNRSGGLPKGHPPLDHFLGIPFFRPNGDLLGLVGIANRPGGYSQRDVQFLEPFTLTCSNLIHAYQHFQKSEQFINKLEEKVQERTSELQIANQRLELANRQQLKHFACCSHELRTPLNCIMGLSSLLLDADHPPVHKESIKMIVSSGDVLLTVVNDVLDYSKLETGNVDIEIRPCNLQETLNSVVHSIEMKARSKHLVMKTSYDCFLPEYFSTDGRRLQQILYNVLGNAVRFSKEEGVVQLSVSLCDKKACRKSSNKVSSPHPHEQDESSSTSSSSKCPFHHRSPTVSSSTPQEYHPIHLSSTTQPADSGSSSRCPFSKPPANADANSISSTEPTAECSSLSDLAAMEDCDTVIRFTIKDYGKGIDEEDFERIFEPFHQGGPETGRLYGGTGLGLAITSKLVNALGGRIAVDSCAGEWAEFTVDLPFRDSRVDSVAVASGLRDTTMILIDKPSTHSTAVMTAVFQQYSVDSVCCTSLAEAGSLISKRSGDRQSFACFLQEDLYQEDSLEELLRNNTALVTFGPKYSAPKTDLHIRSLDQVLPCVLLESICKCLHERIKPRQSSPVPQKTNVIDCVPLLDFRVLVAEDNLVNQKVLVRMLKRLGVKNVDVVDNGEKAVVREAEKQYDVVLMDMQMPVMDGIEACRLINGRREGGHPRPPVVFVTAHASGDYESQCEQAGGKGFLTKPVNLSTIEGCLERLRCERDSKL